MADSVVSNELGLFTTTCFIGYEPGGVFLPPGGIFYTIFF